MQLPLFGEDPGDPPRPSDRTGATALAASHAEAAAIAGQLPCSLRFGTSSWSFPGWKGLVYPAFATQGELAREGLREYARHPLLRTVGIDRSYYAPIPVDDLRRYAEQLPPGFPCCIKAPASVTSAVALAGQRQRPTTRNPDFLSAERFSRDVLEPCALAFSDHAGPFLIQCAPARGLVSPEEFAGRLDHMLDQLPRDFRYAVELRQADWLTEGYARVLRRHGAAHVFNYWSAMPMPRAQAASIPVDTQPFVMVRLLLRPGTWTRTSESVSGPSTGSLIQTRPCGRMSSSWRRARCGGRSPPTCS